MGNINSDQLTCSNLDKLGVDQKIGVPDRRLHIATLIQASRTVELWRNLVSISKVTFPIADKCRLYKQAYWPWLNFTCYF